jgi:hypothetical protein
VDHSGLLKCMALPVLRVGLALPTVRYDNS